MPVSSTSFTSFLSSAPKNSNPGILISYKVIKQFVRYKVEKFTYK
jgi:hypothetical protein